MKKTHPTLQKIVQLLNNGEYHDGTTLGEKCGISRTAVWKVIKKLEAYGVHINSQKKQGYALTEPLSLLNIAKLKRLLQHKKLTIELFESLGSSNDHLKNFCNDSKIRICLCEEQTAARGRFNRTWHVPFAQNLCFSILYPFNKDISELGGVSLVSSLAVVQTLNEVCDLPKQALLKWPNDVIYDNHKLAGVLVDVQAETHSTCYAIIGIGLNVNMVEANPQAISQNWTSVKKITGQQQDRNVLVAKLIDHLLSYLDQFVNEGLHSFMKHWKHYDALFNKAIALQSGHQQIKGMGLGINEQGHLLIKRDDTHKIQAFAAGDTTILK